MKLKFNYFSLSILILSLIILANCRINNKKSEEDVKIDPVAIHIALGQTQQQTQGK